MLSKSEVGMMNLGVNSGDFTAIGIEKTIIQSTPVINQKVKFTWSIKLFHF